MVNPRDIFEEANATYDRLLTLIAVESNTGLRTLQALTYQLKETNDITRDNAYLQLLAEFEAGLQTLAGIKADALNASVDISSCLEGNENELYELLTNYHLELIESTLGVFSDAQRVLTDANEVINGIVAAVILLGDDLAQCGQNLICVSSVLADINIQLYRLPQLIQEEIDDSQTIVGNAQVIIQTFSINTVVRMRTNTARVLRDIRNCVNNIINQ